MPRRKKTGQTYTSLKQASAQLNIPLQHIKIIKSLYPDAFKANNNVDAAKVQEYYNANKGKILEQAEKSIDTLKKEKLSNDIILQRLSIAEKNNKLISLADMHAFLTKLGISLSTLLLAKLVNELPQRIDRVETAKRESLCKDVYNEIVEVLQTDISNWTKDHQAQVKEGELDGDTAAE